MVSVVAVATLPRFNAVNLSLNFRNPEEGFDVYLA